jgi:cell division protein FtsQ
LYIGARNASRITRFVRFCERFEQWQRPRFVGLSGALLLVLGSAGYGVVKGDHIPMIVATLQDTRDAAANAAGFHIASVSLAGQKQVRREEIFATAGVTERTSLLFLDVEAARERLKSIPWIADASVRKLYPDRLQIVITEREPFALWQLDGKVSVISADGTVLAGTVERHFSSLPFVVGKGAEKQARNILAVLDRYPDLRDQVRASIFVAERRWNLRLKNGLDIRLPETDVYAALDRLVAFDRQKNLLSRDIVAIDLRLPDRLTVRLSEAAAQAREEALKDKKPKRKGGDA